MTSVKDISLFCTKYPAKRNAAALDNKKKLWDNPANIPVIIPFLLRFLNKFIACYIKQFKVISINTNTGKCWRGSFQNFNLKLLIVRPFETQKEYITLTCTSLKQLACIFHKSILPCPK